MLIPLPANDLFATQTPPLQRLPMADAELYFQLNFFDSRTSQDALEQLREDTAWRHEQIVLFGRRHWQPRLVAAHGDSDTAYRYSGLTLPMQPWTPLLLNIRQAVEQAAGQSFNSVLLNFYRDQHDSMGWHSDDERELGPQPVIASVSFGAMRTLKFRHKQRRELKSVAMDLTGGSLLVMAGTTQQFWKHAVEKARHACDARINLTFRQILPPARA